MPTQVPWAAVLRRAARGAQSDGAFSRTTPTERATSQRPAHYGDYRDARSHHKRPARSSSPPHTCTHTADRVVTPQEGRRPSAWLRGPLAWHVGREKHLRPGPRRSRGPAPTIATIIHTRAALHRAVFRPLPRPPPTPARDTPHGGLLYTPASLVSPRGTRRGGLCVACACGRVDGRTEAASVHVSWWRGDGPVVLEWRAYGVRWYKWCVDLWCSRVGWRR